jgi:hypothetical protein
MFSPLFVPFPLGVTDWGFNIAQGEPSNYIMLLSCALKIIRCFASPCASLGWFHWRVVAPAPKALPLGPRVLPPTRADVASRVGATATARTGAGSGGSVGTIACRWG